MENDGSIIHELHEIQNRHGFLPREELEALSVRRPAYTLHRLHEVATFFPHFSTEPRTGLAVNVCRDLSCHLAGSAALRAELELLVKEIGPGRIEIRGVSCLGQCDGASAAMIGDRPVRGLTIEIARGLLAEALTTTGGAGSVRHPVLPAAPRGSTGWRIDPYDGREDYAAVRAFTANPDVSALIETLKVSDLRGMGGAGVWAYQKWLDVRQARGDTKYVVVNGDESEPATFKDREILLRAPHVVIEGVILAGLVVGAQRGYIFIRHEYVDQIEAVRAAIARAEEMGVCGRNVLGTGRAFPVEVFVSPGGYICGEQSALIEAMEGKRAEPRNKPPQLETNGLFDRPTLLSNVETFAWVPSIAVRGGDWYRDLGINGCKGARFFSICGDLNRPGVYEVPIGTTLRELVDLAGGLRGGCRLKALAPSGPSGGFLPARLPRALLPRGFEGRVPPRFLAERLPEGTSHLDVLDLELDLQLFRDLGLMLGGGMVVYGENADMLDQALNASEFFRNESCGKCVPCRLGSQKTVDLVRSLVDHKHTPESFPAVESLLGELRRAMEMTSICGLGMVAPNPIATVFRYFRDEISAYLEPVDAGASSSVEGPP